MPHDIGRIEAVARQARAFLVERFIEWKRERGYQVGPDAPPSRDMCRVAAHALASILEAEVGDRWRVIGGWEARYGDGWDAYLDLSALPGGMRDPQGLWRGHYWAACVTGSPRLYADVAADQFGHPEVVLTQEGDPRYRPNLWEETLYEELGDGAVRWGTEWARAFLAARSPRSCAR